MGHRVLRDAVSGEAQDRAQRCRGTQACNSLTALPPHDRARGWPLDLPRRRDRSVRQRRSVAPKDSEDADRTIERKANVFAAELLMPELAVRAAWGELAGCAARFDVSPTAMHWRLFSFGLADKEPQGPDIDAPEVKR